MDEQTQKDRLSALASAISSPFVLRRAVLVLAILAFALHGLQIWRIPYIDRLDGWIYDARLLSSASQTKSQHVVIVDIDEKSLIAFGRWPWARDIMAALVRQLSNQQQAAAIGFNMVFSEPEDPTTDQTFAQALQSQPVVLGYYLTHDRAGHTTGTLPTPIFKINPNSDHAKPTNQWSGYGANLIELTEATPQAGFYNATSDVDGVIRSAPLLAEFQGQYYESLALGLYRRYLAGTDALPSVTPLFSPGHTNHQHFAGIRFDSPSKPSVLLGQISIDDSHTKLIPYRGTGGPNGGSFQYISASDVLLGKLPLGSLKDKVVLIGSSAPALADLRVTPFDRAYPGVEIQANLVAGLIEKRTLAQPVNALEFDVLQLVVIGVLMLIVLPLLSATWAVVATIALALLLWLIHYFLFIRLSLVMPSAAGLGLIFTCFMLHVNQGFFVESKRRKRLTRLFGSYVSPKWVSHMVRSGDNYSMQASNQVLTVMFCDMRGFTHLSQGLSPLALQALLNSIFDRLSEIIQAYGGTIDKYMGDCVMAFWGAPEPQEDHAARAVQCAIALQAAIHSMNQNRTSETPEIKMGIGLNTGLMCVGDMGSSIRRSYTVIGEAVNLAAKLEELCKTYNQGLIISSATKEASSTNSEPIPWQDLGLATVPGSDQPIHIFTLTSHDHHL